MKFTTPAEALAACPELDITATIRISDYSGLVGETVYARINFVECQLIREDGQTCRTRFGAGWVAKRKDGVGVYIGGDCAGRHSLGAGAEGKRYRQDAVALALANRIAALRVRIHARLNDQAFLSQLQSDVDRGEELKTRIVSERDGLPERVLRRLLNTLRGTSRDVPGEVRYVEKEEDPDDSKKVIDVVRWRKTSLGILKGIEALDFSRLGALQSVLYAARNSLRQSAVDESRLEKTLTNQVSKLDAAITVTARLQTIEKALAAFRSPENFQALCWFSIRDDDREAIVARAFEVAGKPAASLQIRKAIATWRQEIEDKHGGRLFRAIQ